MMGIIWLAHIDTTDMLLLHWLRPLLHQQVCYREYCMALSAGTHAEMIDS